MSPPTYDISQPGPFRGQPPFGRPSRFLFTLVVSTLVALGVAGPLALQARQSRTEPPVDQQASTNDRHLPPPGDAATPASQPGDLVTQQPDRHMGPTLGTPTVPPPPAAPLSAPLQSQASTPSSLGQDNGLLTNVTTAEGDIVISSNSQFDDEAPTAAPQPNDQAPTTTATKPDNPATVATTEPGDPATATTTDEGDPPPAASTPPDDQPPVPTTQPGDVVPTPSTQPDNPVDAP